MARHRIRKDTDIVASTTEARRLVSPKTVERVKVRDRSLPCSRCGTAMRWDVSGNHDLGVTLDHLGVQVSDCVGLTRGETRRLVNDISTCALSHRICNVNAGHGVNGPPGGGSLAAGPVPVRTASRTW